MSSTTTNNKRKATNNKIIVQRSKKKQKTNNNKQKQQDITKTPKTQQYTSSSSSSLFDTTFDVLDDLILQTIFSFLNIKPLLNIVNCNKRFQKLLTHEMVVRSAIMDGGDTQKTINQIISLIQNEKIFVPSPLRLLRLANGTKCELGAKCIHPKASSTRVKFVRDTFGVFACWECVTGMTGRNYRWVSDDRSGVLTTTCKLKKEAEILCSNQVAQRRVASRRLVLKEPFYDSYTGERVTALMALSEYQEYVQPIVQKVKNAAITQNKQLQKDKSKKGNNNNEITIKTKDGIQNEAETLTKQLVSQHVKRIKENNNNIWQSSAQIIVETCQQAKQDYERRVQEKIEQQKQQQQNALSARIVKIEKCIAIVAENVKHAESKEIIEAYITNHNVNNIGSCVTFISCIVNEMMRPYVVAPSKGTKKKMVEVAAQLDQFVETLKEKGFLNFSFLKQYYNNTTDKSMAMALYEYLSNLYPTPMDVLLHKNMTTHIFDMVKGDNLLNATCRAFKLYTPYSDQNLDGNYGQGPLPLQVCGEAFAAFMTKYYNMAGNGIISDEAKTWLGRSVWRHVFMKDHGDSSYYYHHYVSLPTNPEDAKDLCVSHFEKAWKVFEEVLPLALEYVEDIRNYSYYPNDNHLFGEESIDDFLIGNHFWSWRLTPSLLLKFDYNEIRERLAATWQRKAHGRGYYRALRIE